MARVLAGLLAASCVMAGCASNTYRIPQSELARLTLLPPEERGARVKVSSQLHDIPAAGATRVEQDDVIIVPQINISASGGSGGGGGGGHGGVGHIGGAGGDGKAAAIVFLVIAATAMAIGVGVEGSRFDGWVRLHPMQPVHLYGADGSYALAPLAALDPSVMGWVDRAYVRSTEGPWLELERAPLWRQGFTYSMYGGVATMKSAAGDKALGTAFTVQGGYFLTQQIGLQASAFFGWRDNRVREVLFDSRWQLELTAMPITVGKFHAGVYGGAGVAYRYEDGIKGGSDDPSSGVFSVGTQLQLELRTRIALTARLGLARAHGDRASDMMVGLSIY